ncbi:MAG: hypothetical protein M1814_002393 [Vezdaea aestivalis]|nr:MAG: hypothetical protein M1814_002393 [Vezdaea aestivalis]
MGPSISPHHRHLSRERLSALLSSTKPVTYHDPANRGSPYAIQALAWTPTGHLIATGSHDRTIRIWNPDRPHHRHTTELKAGSPGYGNVIEKVSWNPEHESQLLSVSNDGFARFWDVRDKKCVAEVNVGGEPFSCAWAPDGRTVVVGRKDDKLVAIDLRDMSIQESHQQSVQTNQLAFGNASEPMTLLATTGEGHVRLINYPDMKFLHTLKAHTSPCFCVAMSPRGDYVATGGSDAIISLWDTEYAACHHALGKMTGPVRSVGFSWDGSFVCGGSDEGTGIEVAHVSSGEYIGRIETLHPARLVEWHPSRYWIAYSGDPSGLKIVGAAGGGL